ncbi:MAG: hypothetical protein M3383_04955 [Actinomycetota bacterium]|nr:hypothetical protein [Actinomycetota bacterium]
MEEVLEAEAIEEDTAGASAALPAAAPAAEVAPFRNEARTVAIAAAGGVVAGAATVAVVKAAGRAAAPKRSKRRFGRKQEVVASRSFLVDVHMLGNR